MKLKILIKRLFKEKCIWESRGYIGNSGFLMWKPKCWAHLTPNTGFKYCPYCGKLIKKN